MSCSMMEALQRLIPGQISFSKINSQDSVSQNTSILSLTYSSGLIGRMDIGEVETRFSRLWTVSGVLNLSRK